MNRFSPLEQQYGLPVGLLHSVMGAESGGDPNAISPKGAQGAFQIMPETAKELGVDPLDPAAAAVGAAKYLKQNYDKFGDWKLALAAYNAGPGNVQKYGGIPPFKETQDYVKRVESNMAQQPTSTQTQELSFANQSSWKSRAKPIQQQQGTQPLSVEVTPSWKARAKPIEAPPPTLMESIQADYGQRNQEMQQSADLYNQGEQNIGSALYQGANAYASNFTDTVGNVIQHTPVVGPALDLLGEHVIAPGAKLLSKGIGAVVPDKAEESIGNFLLKTSDEHPEAMRNLKATGQLINSVGTAIGVGQAAKLGRKAILTKNARLAGVEAEMAATKANPKMSTADLDTAAGDSYVTARELGANYKPDQLANPFVKAVQEAKPKAIGGVVLTKEEKSLISHLEDYDGLDGQNLTLDDLDRLDKGLTQKMNNPEFVDPKTGQLTNNGRILNNLQNKLRQTVDEVPDDPASAALSNGRALFAAKAMSRDLDTVAERASFSQGDQAKALQRGYASLYMDKDRIRGWPQEAKDLLKKAATPGIGMDLLRPVTSRLTAIIAGGTGNMVAGAGANIVGMAARGANEAYIAGKGAKIQQKIVDNALGKLKEVKPKPEVGPLLLEGPNTPRPSPPMTDTQINIAQKLMEKGNKPPLSDPSGPAIIRPPVSQMNRMKESFPEGSNKAGQYRNMQNKLIAGELSQNKFVEDAVKSFGLSQKEARSLAQEIKKYGETQTPKPKPPAAPAPTIGEQLQKGAKPNPIVGAEDAGKTYSGLVPTAYKGEGHVYGQKVYKGPETGVLSGHFPQKGYYSHVRYTDDASKNRTIHEIQSDVHGKGKKFVGDYFSAEIEDLVFEHSAEISGKEAENYFMRKLGLSEDEALDQVMEASHGVADFLWNDRVPTTKQLAEATGIKDEPTLKRMLVNIERAQDEIAKERAKLPAREEFKGKDDKWLRNTINKTLDEATEEGKRTLRFNITDASELRRASGVQKWYEDAVVNTLKKMANDRGLSSELKDGYMTIKLKKGK